jgi:hypothetical protein
VIQRSRRIRSGPFRVGIVLVALLVGTLSGIDNFADHSPSSRQITPHPRNTGDGNSTDSFDAHFGPKEPPRCNACYFHKLLSQTLISGSQSVAVVQRSTQHLESRLVRFIHLQFDPEIDRGPPTS